MNENKIAIIGFGMVGKASSVALSIPRFDCFTSKDKDQLVDGIKNGRYDIFVLCLPTPTTVDGKQDLTAIGEWLTNIKHSSPISPKLDPLIIIRSTILPGTTKILSEEYGLRIAHVPEFLTEATAIKDELNPEFLVIGADDILVRQQVKELFMNSKIQSKRFLMCNSVTAELIKYSLNSWFALKVIMGNQLWDVARKVGADYEKIQEVLTEHKWGSKNGWNVWHGGFRGYGGTCLPKDLEAFSIAFDIPLLKEVDRINSDLIGVNKELINPA